MTHEEALDVLRDCWRSYGRAQLHGRRRRPRLRWNLPRARVAELADALDVLGVPRSVSRAGSYRGMVEVDGYVQAARLAPLLRGISPRKDAMLDGLVRMALRSASPVARSWMMR